MWPPVFRFVETRPIAADAINQPHEDYPIRVSKTEEMIDCIGDLDTITGTLVRVVHSAVMGELPDRGRYRTINVRVGGHNPPSFLKVQEMMDAILPMTPMNRYDLEAFYRTFEEIHPFSDGNGRVGGIVIAAFSFRIYGEYLISGV